MSTEGGPFSHQESCGICHELVCACDPFADPAYLEFVESAAKACRCCSECSDVPCAGCLAGGICDQMCHCGQKDDYENAFDADYETDDE